MSRRARFAAAFTSLVLLGRSPHAAEQAWKPPKVEGWIEAKSPHFTYYSSVGEDKTRKIATQLERFRLTLGRITKGLNLDEHEKTSIYVFRNDPAFTPYKLDGRGEPENIAGYFMARPYGNYVALDASAGFTPMRVVYHEYFHSVAHATLGDVPPWLDEGLAEYFSTFHTEGPSAVIQV